MPREFRNSQAMMSQTGFHFKQMVKCFGLGLGYFFQNRYFDVLSFFQLLGAYIGERLPGLADFFSYHKNMMVTYRRQIGARFAMHLLIGFAIAQTPMIFAAKAGFLG